MELLEGIQVCRQELHHFFPITDESFNKEALEFSA
jgi:hypothetical protein